MRQISSEIKFKMKKIKEELKQSLSNEKSTENKKRIREIDEDQDKGKNRKEFGSLKLVQKIGNRKQTCSLYAPQFDKPFQRYTNTSATDIGACLSQLYFNEKENSLAFYSLTPCQTKWFTIEREIYTVLVALQKFDT